MPLGSVYVGLPTLMRMARTSGGFAGAVQEEGGFVGRDNGQDAESHHGPVAMASLGRSAPRRPLILGRVSLVGGTGRGLAPGHIGGHRPDKVRPTARSSDSIGPTQSDNGLRRRILPHHKRRRRAGACRTGRPPRWRRELTLVWSRPRHAAPAHRRRHRKSSGRSARLKRRCRDSARSTCPFGASPPSS